MNPWGSSIPSRTESRFFNAARRTSFLLVEGETDKRFWASRVDKGVCEVRAPAGGKDGVLKELRDAGDDGQDNFVAILDADFGRLQSPLEEAPNIVWTDYHDLEMVLIRSPALERLLVEVGTAEKITEWEEKNEPVRKSLIDRAVQVGRLRWLSHIEAHGLIFRKKTADGYSTIDYAKFCDRTSWTIDLTKLVQTVVNYSQKHGQNVSAWVDKVRTVSDTLDPWQLANGHDATALLAVGLQRVLGSSNRKPVEIEEGLRLAFDAEYLGATEMFRALLRWEENHPPFRIFRPSEGRAMR